MVQKDPPGGRWLFVILGTIIMLCLGSVYSWSVFVNPLTAHFAAMGQTVSASEVLLPFQSSCLYSQLPWSFPESISKNTGLARWLCWVESYADWAGCWHPCPAQPLCSSPLTASSEALGWELPTAVRLQYQPDGSPIKEVSR